MQHSGGKKKKANKRISLSPLTPEQALAAALQVKKTDVDKLEAKQKADKQKKRAPKK